METKQILESNEHFKAMVESLKTECADGDVSERLNAGYTVAAIFMYAETALHATNEFASHYLELITEFPSFFNHAASEEIAFLEGRQ